MVAQRIQFHLVTEFSLLSNTIRILLKYLFYNLIMNYVIEILCKSLVYLIT